MPSPNFLMKFKGISMHAFRIVFGLAVLIGTQILSNAYAAAESTDAKKITADRLSEFSIKPVLLDVKDSAGTVIGLDYSYVKTFSKAVKFGDKGSAEIETAIPLTEWAGQVSAKGTVASQSDKNPNKFLDFNGSYQYMSYQKPLFYAYGAKAKYETDQPFNNKQFVFGLTGTAAYFMPNTSFIGVDLGLQRINPSTDTARKKALGGASLDNYQRLEAEFYAHFLIPGDIKSLSDVEVSYRHFQELSPSDAVRNAGLNRNRLGQIRLNFTNSMFVAYSKGSLPFDTQSSRTVKIGWSYKLN